MRVVRSSTAESVARGVILLAIALAARLWFADLMIVGLVRIDVAIIGLSLLAMERGMTFGIVTGFLMGLVLDAVHPAWMGASAAGYAVVGYFSGSFGQTLYMERSMARALLVMGAVVIYDLIFGLLSVGVADSLWRAAVGTLGSAILSGAAALIITRAIKQWRSAAATDADLAGNG